MGIRLTSSAETRVDRVLENDKSHVDFTVCPDSIRGFHFYLISTSKDGIVIAVKNEYLIENRTRKCERRQHFLLFNPI